MATDHPRSRGVYCDSTLLFARISGSSPLARGLPGTVKIECLDLRIIPARAGFTQIKEGDLIVCRDHPRSRGVYIGW